MTKTTEEVDDVMHMPEIPKDLREKIKRHRRKVLSEKTDYDYKERENKHLNERG